MMQQNKMLQIIFCWILAVVQGSPSLVFLSTGRLTPHSEPSFEQLTLFDGVAISFCDSGTRREQFKSRLKTTQLPQECGQAYADILESIHDIQEHVNRTLEVVQRRRGCSRSADGTVSGFEAWAVNGVDFLTFEPGVLKWTSRSPSAKRLQQLWNQNKARNFVFAHFIKYHCPVVMRKTALAPVYERTEVRIFAKFTPQTDEVQLRCHVTSSEQSVRSVRLIGDGAPNVRWLSETGPLPGGGGSVVVLRLAAGVSIKEGLSRQYGCTVQTEKRNITTFWNGKNLEGKHVPNKSGLLRMAMLIAGFFAICFLMILLAQFVICLHTCFRLKYQRRSHRVDPLVLEQLTKLMEGDVSPETRNILVSLVYDANFPDELSNSQLEWEEMKSEEDVILYDLEFFANQTCHYDSRHHKIPHEMIVPFSKDKT